MGFKLSLLQLLTIAVMSYLGYTVSVKSYAPWMKKTKLTTPLANQQITISTNDVSIVEEVIVNANVNPVMSVTKVQETLDVSRRNYAPWTVKRGMQNLATEVSSVTASVTESVTSSVTTSVEDSISSAIAEQSSTAIENQQPEDVSIKFTEKLHADDVVYMTEQNFNDLYVDAISEGSSSSNKILQSIEVISEKVVSNAANSKDVNFVDDSTVCTSEGGSWKIAGHTLPDLIKPEDLPKGEIDVLISNFANLIVQKTSLIIDLVKVENSALGILKTCDMLDDVELKYDWLDKLLIKSWRSILLSQLLANDRSYYIETVNFLHNRIPRNDLPNVQNVPYPTASGYGSVSSNSGSSVADCILPDKAYDESILDKVLLSIFRKLVQKEINFQSPTSGIKGLLEEGKHYMLSEEGTPENQHKFVKNTLSGLFTPFLPPFYRIFMAG